jgi:uncharacterized protein
MLRTWPWSILATLVLVTSTFPQSNSDRPLVTVSGQGEVLVVPDEVVFNLTVSTLEKGLPAAQKKNDGVVAKVLELARTYDIPPAHVQTGYINLEEKYSDEEATRKPSVFLGYQVTKKISLVLRDVKKAEALLADIFKSGVTRINDVSFRSTQIRRYKDQARALAIKAAQDKASALAREIGQTIGKAYTISEEGTNFGGLPNASNSMRSVGESYSESESTIALGQISVTARVVVSFELK